MRMLLKRIYNGKTYTIGKLYCNGEYFCDTLEDVVRPKGEKVYGQTAIPEGKYKVIITMSNRFKKMLPLILDVPNFAGVRIHSGNYADHKEYWKTIDIPKGYDIISSKEYFKVV